MENFLVAVYLEVGFYLENDIRTSYSLDEIDRVSFWEQFSKDFREPEAIFARMEWACNNA
jgi:hypothetical protein